MARPEPQAPAEPICPLCLRPVPPAEQDAHHWVPRSRGGRETAILHRICHRQVHALLDEDALARQYHSAQALLGHPQVAAFARWVSSKPPHFHERTRKSRALRRG
ncbi:HNH endonuclease [Ramlibacter aquaticus]|uniref:HNH endonuclease n=1 Tax=Ramlibacter aquaticus TaxID=2780094 RepID=A0ABR9SKH9_9BURK|nr:HNH endonuclease [Ramlibacter aquaticus]